MVFAVLLAWVFPGPGGEGGWMHPDVLNKIAVGMIFYLNGAGLSFPAMRSGALHWRLHLVVQLATFALFPLIGWALYVAGAGVFPAALVLGFFYLCALPSTVSSSVAMTSAARGNVPAAVFNATLASLLGVFLTPLWIGLALGSGVAGGSAGGVIVDLLIWLILPLVIGQLTRPLVGGFVKRHQKGVHLVDRGAILLIIYTSFCDSVQRGVWHGQGLLSLGLTLVVSVLLFTVVFWVVTAVCRRMKFSTEDRIAAVFCGSKKSLAAGVPMAQLIFIGDARLGLILLPLMIYHSMQLVICGVLASRWARR